MDRTGWLIIGRSADDMRNGATLLRQVKSQMALYRHGLPVDLYIEGLAV
jgi:hypothetical protein